MTTDRIGPLVVQDISQPTEIAQSNPIINIVEESVHTPVNNRARSSAKSKSKAGKKKGKGRASESSKKVDNSTYQDILQEAELISASISQTETESSDVGPSETSIGESSVVAEVKVENDSYLVKFDEDYEEAYDRDDDFNDIETAIPSTSQTDQEDSETVVLSSSEKTISPSAKKRKVSDDENPANLLIDISAESPAKVSSSFYSLLWPRGLKLFVCHLILAENG